MSAIVVIVLIVFVVGVTAALLLHLGYEIKRDVGRRRWLRRRYRARARRGGRDE